MPELPEVERFRRVGIEAGLGHRIVDATVREDALVLAGCEADEIAEGLRGRRLVSVDRKGKYLWWVFDRGPCLLFHFGMTGALRSNIDAPLALKTAKSHDLSWPPARAILFAKFSSEAEVAFISTRRMSRLRWLDDPLLVPPVSALGPDVKDALPAVRSLQSLFSSTKGSIKGALLDQHKLAGLGNWMVDEVLFLAKISPRRKCVTLSLAECEALRMSITEVVNAAVEAGADASRFPSEWLFHQRWSATRNPKSLRAGLALTTVVGRPTIFDPRRQK